MTHSTPLIPAKAGIHLDISLVSRLRGSERNIEVMINHLTRMTSIRTPVTAINICVMLTGFMNCRMASQMITKSLSVLFGWIVSATHFVNLMFTTRLRIFVNTVISHVILLKKEAGLTMEHVNVPKKLSYLFSAPTSGLMQIWKMLESSRLQPWRFVFPNVTQKTGSEKTIRPYPTNKKVVLLFCLLNSVQTHFGGKLS